MFAWMMADKGDTGRPGPPGAKGDKGDRGPRGRRGFRGRSFSGYEPRALAIYTAFVVTLMTLIILQDWHL